MKVKIITGTKITKVIRSIKAIKNMNKKGIILTPVVKVLISWEIAQNKKFPYYRVSK